MKRASIIIIQLWILTALVLMLASHLARADGGIVQLRETRGPFSVTIFVSPEVVSGGLTDVSVLVQSQRDGEVMLDAYVTLSLTPPQGVVINESDPFCGTSSGGAASQSPYVAPHPLAVRATREKASNKLLYAALLKLDAAGNWPLQVSVSRGADSARFHCLLPVSAASAKLSGLWPYLAFPPIAIVAFALNQKLRKSSLEKAVHAGFLPCSGTLKTTKKHRRLVHSEALPIYTERPFA